MKLVDNINSLIGAGGVLYLTGLGEVNKASLLSHNISDNNHLLKFCQGYLLDNTIIINDIPVVTLRRARDFCFGRLFLDEFKKLVSEVSENSNHIIRTINNYIRDIHFSRQETSVEIQCSNIINDKEFRVFFHSIINQQKYSNVVPRFIIDYPRSNLNSNNIHIYTIDDFFKIFKEDIVFVVDRIWIGQCGSVEHRVAKSIYDKSPNSQWIFNTIFAQPKPDRNCGFSRWRTNVEQLDRRVVYYLSIIKKNS